MVLGPFKHPDLSKVCIPGSYLCTGQASKLVIKVDASEHLELVGAALLHRRDLHLVGLDHRQQALREDPPGRGRGSLLPTCAAASITATCEGIVVAGECDCEVAGYCEVRKRVLSS